MKTFAIAFTFTLLFLTALQAQTLNALKKRTSGYWEIPLKERSIRKGNEILSPGNDMFYYDGNYVTIKLYTFKAWMWKSDDDYYMLKSKWNNDSLFYLPPFGQWTYLARFNSNNFYCEEHNEKWHYVKLNKEQIAQNDSAILKERKLHDYNIKPTDNHSNSID